MKRLLLTVALGVVAMFATFGATPPRVSETQVLRHDPKDGPKVIQQGKASYYADKFHGRKTATGERMDQNALTAASKELPLGSRAKVTNLATGESVIVDINDRGPFVPGRVIDLSKRAAQEINIHEDGVAPVKVEAKPEDQPTAELSKKVAKVAVAREKAQAAAKTRAAKAAAKAVQTARKKSTAATQVAENPN